PARPTPDAAASPASPRPAPPASDAPDGHRDTEAVDVDAELEAEMEAELEAEFGPDPHAPPAGQAPPGRQDAAVTEDRLRRAGGDGPAASR
ncbi:MAG TPA: hypothetical protein VGD67_06435, partial [Pseudonocardiaceae bacterium]